MGKRSNFQRVPRDFYVTPQEAVVPLLSHLPRKTRFVEPCAGDGALVRHLEAAGHVCIGAYDIEPRGPGIVKKDALKLVEASGGMYITNPPWSRDVLHPLIDHLRVQKPTWMLLDADWMHTKQASPYLDYCNEIVSVGRVRWIEGSKMTGKDNCCWYLFLARAPIATAFYGR